MKRMIRPILLSAALAGAMATQAQTTAFGDNLNVVTSAMPMLNIGPDARMGGMANAGVAASPDANALFWNPAKLAFMGAGNMQGGLSYTPWLRRLVPDVELMFANVAMGLGDRSGVGASLRYFSLGDITFRNEQGDEQGTYRPYEMALDVAYALKLSENWSAGVGLRYAMSDLTQGQVVGSLQTKPGQTVATDVSFYYQGEELNLPDGQKGQWLGGLNISNIGAKVKYTESGDADFIPTNMKLGVGYNWILDRYNRVVVLFDVNKLLVPTQPVRDLLDVDGDGDRYEIIAGKDDQVPVMQGIFQSWDPSAKPDGMKELMREFMFNAGVEYWYDDKFAVRGGYQHEDALKGNRRFFTIGFGLRYSLLGLDFAYLFPADQTVRSPLENTIRFSALVDLNQLLD
ncbi:type IX secretion system outer membrane channel protein PorV [Schleiferiaceae bacterium]|nr:type IX secretion system outer membrane channel protein PorV [Schleiferiaceae bacterium]MDA9151135.1 type IX secretion system outer membrane channel protein PorV [Schleiferiaceae bacterium]